ncbi:MAG: aminopeptidase P family protein [Luteibaculaceae bacterium]
MRYTPLSKELYIFNRQKFTKNLKGNSLAVFNSNDIYPTSADGHMPFVQHKDIFYLSGVDQEESILLLYPHCHNPLHREILFLRETNEEIAIWEGEKLTKEKATALSGIETIYWLKDFPRIFKTLMAEADNVYLNTNEHLRATTAVQTREDRFIVQCKQEFPLHNYQRSAPIMQYIRSIKHPLELEQMQKACNITEAAFRRILSFIKPGKIEYEIEAEIIHEFIKSGSRGFAYTPIIASGFNANVLHYIENNKVCKDGDVILMDFGAEYGNYASDLSRSVPVNGKFTERQKKVYNAVLQVKKEATKLLKPGNILSEYHKQVGLLMEEQLLILGLITKEDIKNQSKDWPAYKKYFMHGTSHFIGLDTHDNGLWHKPIEAGMVFTVEPGIYIRNESLGIRIEDDVLVVEKGEPKNLMQNIPIEVEEIEDLMHP